MIALDLHAPQIQGFFDIPIDHLMGVPILAQHFENDPDINPEECVVVSPDHGGVTRAHKLADILKLNCNYRQRRPETECGRSYEHCG